MTLCEICNSLSFEEDKSGLIGTQLGAFKEIQARAADGCDACRFFKNVLQTSSRWRTKLDELSERVIFLDSLRLDARRPTAINSCVYSVDDLCLDLCVSEDHEGPRDEDVDCVRRIPVNSEDEKCLAQIRSWSAECATHDSCTNATAVPLPQRIIKISPDPTVAPWLCSSNGRSGAYVILSYCSDDIHSTQEELGDSDSTILDVDSLPRTMVDGIDVARRLGYRYLWSRTLCISRDDWEKDPAKVVSIYGQAALMLVATAGEDASSGLFHDRQVYYSPALGHQKDRYLRQKHLRWTSYIEESAVAKRGWGIVERMLTPRIAHFTKHQLIWECSSGFQFEASGILDSKTGSGQARQHYAKKVVQPYIDDFIQGRDKDTRSIGKGAEQVARLEAWHRCVNAYSGGSVTVPSDKLLIMAPLAYVFNDGTLGEYLAGTWSKEIAFGLAWARPYFLLRPTSQYRAPSWSWASIDGTVDSLCLSWPEDLMQGHADNPFWIKRYQPRLVSHHMILADPSRPHGVLQEGSHIVIEGSCIGVQKLTGALFDQDAFHVTMVLDQSQMFDCPCCSPRPEETQRADLAEFNSQIQHHVCMIVQGDAWRVQESWSAERGFCDLLVLKTTERGDAFARVGFFRLQKKAVWGEEKVDSHAIFDALPWERRELKLV
ncbi:putative HET domain protein [Aspergillus clavatus NRRL 1]|uniref:HET domain protein n=1 Tax=Aspergillus clavatus (strain ATCC 1007 / CBS 513.65 / DSM 816 / NCTC 3887 / NRRL 1 / QM 1276 / 107) TaxID=344612 RepID=A1C6R0_ASPCL|nr:HET domain protein [Aspergillus clavatus NRRL 1]EAW14081.1 HET domain protein [Aspergillus clavatus NRRL 1]